VGGRTIGSVVKGSVGLGRGQAKARPDMVRAHPPSRTHPNGRAPGAPPKTSFKFAIPQLQSYWAGEGCGQIPAAYMIWEMGAGPFNPARPCALFGTGEGWRGRHMSSPRGGRGGGGGGGGGDRWAVRREPEPADKHLLPVPVHPEAGRRREPGRWGFIWVSFSSFCSSKGFGHRQRRWHDPSARRGKNWERPNGLGAWGSAGRFWLRRALEGQPIHLFQQVGGASSCDPVRPSHLRAGKKSGPPPCMSRGSRASRSRDYKPRFRVPAASTSYDQVFRRGRTRILEV